MTTSSEERCDVCGVMTDEIAWSEVVDAYCCPDCFWEHEDD